MDVMETQRRKQHNFTENNMWALLWHGLPVAALLLWGAFCITNSLWYDEAYSASMVSLRAVHAGIYAAGKILCGKIV